MNKQKERLLRKIIGRYYKKTKQYGSNGEFIFSGRETYDDNSRCFPVLKKDNDAERNK